MIVPEENRAPSDASQNTAEATSSGPATRPNGDCLRTSSPPGPSRTSRAISVCTKPGATVATLMSCGARASAIDWLKAFIPALEAP